MGEQKGFDLLAQKRRLIFDRNSAGQQEAQNDLSKFTARDRVARLLDPQSFVETLGFAEHSVAAEGLKQVSAPGEGVITGYGTIDGRGVYVFSQDSSVLGGSIGVMHAKKIVKLLDTAAKTGLPVIALLDSKGARIAEGAAALDGFGKIISKLAELSGVVPIITGIFGQCAATAAFFPPLSDFVFMVEGLGGIYAVAPAAFNEPGKPADTEAIGGAKTHAQTTGLAHYLCDNENDLFCSVRQLLSYLPDNNLTDAPVIECSDDLNRQLNIENSDMRTVVSSVLDEAEFFECSACYAQKMITGFGRVNGKSVGLVANMPGSLLDDRSCRKAANFISMCDSFGLPVLTFADTLGFEKEVCSIKAGAALMRAYSEATVPLISVITANAIGAGYVAMASKSLGADVVFAWPDAVISCLPADAASIIVMEDKNFAAGKPEKARAQAAQMYEKTFASPWEAAKLGYVDEVIYPSETRQRVAGALEFAAGKQELRLPKKHGTKLY